MYRQFNYNDFFSVYLGRAFPNMIVMYIFECTDRCWFTPIVGGFSQETCNLVNSGCWMFAPHLLPSIPLSSSAAGNLTTRQASPGKRRHRTWHFWKASLIMTDSISAMNQILRLAPQNQAYSFWCFCIVCVFGWCNVWLWWIASLGLFKPTLRTTMKIWVCPKRCSV